MILYHATPESNVESILAVGLLASYATGPVKRIWFHELELQCWARGHIAKRHGVRPDQVAVLRIRIGKTWLHEFSPGIYWTYANVAEEDIQAIVAPLPPPNGPLAS